MSKFYQTLDAKKHGIKAVVDAGSMGFFAHHSVHSAKFFAVVNVLPGFWRIKEIRK